MMAKGFVKETDWSGAIRSGPEKLWRQLLPGCQWSRHFSEEMIGILGSAASCLSARESRGKSGRDELQWRRWQQEAESRT